MQQVHNVFYRRYQVPLYLWWIQAFLKCCEVPKCYAHDCGLKISFLSLHRTNSTIRLNQSVIFKLLSYCFEETIGFDINASFARSPVSQYNKRVLRLFSSTGLLMDWKLQTEIRIYASFLSKHEFRQIKPLKMSFPWSFYSSFSIAELLCKATLPPVPTDIP